MRIARSMVLLLMPAAGLAQAGPPLMELPPPVPATTPNQAPKYAGVVYGQPVTALRTRDTSRVLGDGTKIEHHTAIFFCRDSAGRTRNDTTPEHLPGKKGAADLVYTSVVDADLHIELNWNNKSKVATLRHLPAHPLAATAPPDPKPLGPEEKRVVWIGPAGQRQRMEATALPGKTIEGLETRGSRVVKFVPAGKEGNDRDLVTTIDSWYQPELHLALLTDTTDPAMGHTVLAFSRINREEPPASLFAPPPGYTVRELPDRQPAKPEPGEPDPTLIETQNPVADVEAVPTPQPSIVAAPRPGGTSTPPIVLFAPQPVYSEAAMKARIGGTVKVYLQVDEKGLPANVRVIRAMGMGLDEKAVECVKGYRFKPATQDGQPVRVDLYIDVNFQAFPRP